MTTQVYINLPVKNLHNTMEFFEKLGFKFDMTFTNDKAACMILNTNAYVMLLDKDFFQTFTKKAIADSSISTETIICISAESSEEVDRLVDTAFLYGGIESKEPQNEGWMYTRSFQDLDGHIWEVTYMDAAAIPN